MKKILFMLLMAPMVAMAGTGTWTSKVTGGAITYKTTDASKPAKDSKGKVMTVVYMENLSCEKIGRNSNATDVAWLLGEGYRVIELDYAHHANAVATEINQDIMEINSQLQTGAFAGCSDISTDRAYVLFEGYRLRRDVGYYKDDPTVYNYPEAYRTMEGDSLYMDIVYPANPSREVPVVLSFSYSNSFHGNEHKRMFLGYQWGAFKDTFMEGAPAMGVAWAIADHPKYCDWGRGNRAGGAQKEYGSIEVTPDAARKVRAAIRTVRAYGRQVGMGSSVALYGFSRGSTAASLAISEQGFEEWDDMSRCPEYARQESAAIQAAFLGPGVFDYSTMPTTSREYTNMTTYCNSTATPAAAWRQQGGLKPLSEGLTGTGAPVFLFYNTSDEAYYDAQMKSLMAVYDKHSLTYQLVTNYGQGHSVPQDKATLQKMYDFLKAHTQTTTGVKKAKKMKQKTRKQKYTLSGQSLADDALLGYKGVVIAGGKKILL